MTGRPDPQPTPALDILVYILPGIYRHRPWFILMGLVAVDKCCSDDPCDLEVSEFFLGFRLKLV